MPFINNKLILRISSAINSVGLSLQQLNSGPKTDHLESLLGEVGKKARQANDLQIKTQNPVTYNIPHMFKTRIENTGQFSETVL